MNESDKTQKKWSEMSQEELEYDRKKSTVEFLLLRNSLSKIQREAQREQSLRAMSRGFRERMSMPSGPILNEEQEKYADTLSREERLAYVARIEKENRDRTLKDMEVKGRWQYIDDEPPVKEEDIKYINSLSSPFEQYDYIQLKLDEFKKRSLEKWMKDHPGKDPNEPL